jgi:hypothetical protein
VVFASVPCDASLARQRIPVKASGFVMGRAALADRSASHRDKLWAACPEKSRGLLATNCSAFGTALFGLRLAKDALSLRHRGGVFHNIKFLGPVGRSALMPAALCFCVACVP